MITRFGNISETGELVKFWKRLEISVPALRIFQTSEWCRLAWECRLLPNDSELYILLWRQDGMDDFVVFPLYLDASGSLRFIMDEHSDYCDCVYVPGRNHHVAFKEALEYIKGDRRVKRIVLHKMDGDSEALNYFSSLAPNARVVKENTYSWIEVAPSDDFAAAQPQLRSKDKANIRAIRRKGERFVLDIANMGGGYPSQDVDMLVEAMRREGWREQEFMPKPLKDFCRRLYESGKADIAQLRDADGKIVALNYILRMGGRRLSWIFLYADSHASTELYVKYFYSDAVDGEFVFDFGTGGYEYKLGTFRPKTRALFALGLDFDPKLGFRLSVARLVRSCKDCIRAFFALIVNGNAKGHSIRQQPPQHAGVVAKSRRERNKTDSPA